MRCGFVAAALAVFSAAALSFAQETPPSPTVDPRYAADDDAALTRQAGALLAEVDATLAKSPPKVPEPDDRRLALRLVDAVLHDVFAPNRVPVQQFYHRRIEHAVAEMEATKVTEGAMVWRLYNHGFVVRTASVTLGFDLYRGPSRFRGYTAEGKREAVACPGFPISDDLAKRLVAQCDVLFVSHPHGDHVDPFVVGQFLEAGKPVVGPEPVLQKDPLGEKLTRLRREADVRQKLPVQQGKQTLDVVVYPGQQYQSGGVPNNVVIVYTPDGISVSHNGDEMNDPYPQYQEDFKWIDKVHETQKVDILLTNCWLNDPLRFAKGFAPRIIFSGHENEMGHPMWDRVPYWGDTDYIATNYLEMKKAFPTVSMAWGESFRVAR